MNKKLPLTLMETELVKEARVLAESIFHRREFDDRAFHNMQHTLDVVAAAKEIGEQSGLTPDEMESLLVAAWLHDIGYAEGADDHEQKAALKASELLMSRGASQRKIAEVTEAIMATKMPQQPKSAISRVLCDADLYHLSTKQCTEKGDMLRKEWETMNHKTMSEDEWAATNLDFMESHRYHTAYGQTILQKGKKKNIKRLRKQIHPNVNEENYHELEAEIVKLKLKLEKEKILKPDRGIETMFRTTSHNHLMLSQMADNKANILITINSIILSVVVSILIRKLDENPYLVVPTILLVTVCLATTVFAILSTRPTVTRGRFTRQEVEAKKINLLFFGNFHDMKVDDYEWSMKEMMKDADYLYGSLIKDIYYLGIVLGKKYKFLRIAYNVFMFGFVLSVLSFIIVFMMNHGI